jgi:hypothetical protein
MLQKIKLLDKFIALNSNLYIILSTWYILISIDSKLKIEIYAGQRSIYSSIYSLLLIL